MDNQENIQSVEKIVDNIVITKNVVQTISYDSLLVEVEDIKTQIFSKKENRSQIDQDILNLESVLQSKQDLLAQITIPE